MPRKFMGSFARALAASGLCLGVALAPLAPAGAAPAAPTGLTSSSDPIPVLTWDHSTGATSYVVELSRTADSSGLISSSTTVNRKFVPTATLPTPTSGSSLYWRVAAKDSTVGDYTSWTEISRGASYAAPVVTAPVDAHLFTQPDEPARLAWLPVPGTQEYEVQVSTDQSFTDPTKLETFKTVSTTLILPRPQVATSYWFKVRARLSASTSGPSAVYTAYSTARQYSVSALPVAARLDPATDDAVIEDAFLDWNPVRGAKTYDIQIATDPAFGSIVHQRLGITGTSYARPAGLNNDTYYWRVRAADVANNVPTWGSQPTWKFTRDWPDLPVPVYPANPADVNPSTPDDADLGTTVGDPMYFEWKPVRFASMYKIELSSNSTFSAPLAGTCYTRNTTFTPAAQSDCMPGAAGTYWWRVTAMDQITRDEWRPLDYPITSQTVFHDAKFTYSPQRPQIFSPTDGATVQVPTLTWSPVAGAAKYRVRILTPGGGVAVQATTVGTSFTPPSKLTPGTYRWDVFTVSNQGWFGSSLLSGQPTFTVVAQDPATAVFPDVVAPTGDTSPRTPMLRWTPVADAIYYKIWIRTAGNVDAGWDVLDDAFEYPAGTDISAEHLAPGKYEWQVRAIGETAGVGFERASRTRGTFTVGSPAPVTGQANALTMTAYKAGQSCAGFECTDLRQTPVLRWNPDPDTGFYKIWVARNSTLTNLVPPGQLGMRTNPFPVSGTLWNPTTTLQESTAGEAYFWAVQPCTADGKCAANPVPLNSFNKASNRVESTGPGVPVVDGVPQGTVPVQSDDVTLEWKDYLQTNTEASQGSSQLATKSGQAAREYEVQVASNDTFADTAILDTARVDQRKFTSFAATYPEGKVYWRVRAIDSSGNPLPWSITRGFDKQSPVPELNLLSGPQSSTPTLSWKPLNFASSYQLELYVKGASVPKYTVTSNQVQWSPTTAAQALAPGEYEWRVRRLDAQNKLGGWSAKQVFIVSNSAPTLISPSAGGTVAPRDSVFTWAEVPDATDYRVTLVPPTGSPITQVTKATAWAPLTKLTTGTWTWRVETRDANGVVSAQSGTQSFVVSTDVMASAAPRIEGSGQIDTVLLGFAPVWTRTPDSVTYQWLRGSTPVGDGTLSYTVTQADRGQKITLRATAVTAGYPDVTSVSNAITAVDGAAPVATTPPTISGTAMVGQPLTAGMPTWNAGDVTTTLRWLVNGASVGTAPTFSPRATDLGKQVTLEVTGKRAGYATAVVTSAPVTVQPGGSLQATVQPTVSGTPDVGQTLKANGGTWSQASPTLTYQWVRTGVPIPGATGSAYKLTPEDAGKDVAVVVAATTSGFSDGAATSAAVAVNRMASTAAGTLKANRVKAGKAAKLSITVTVSGLATPSGVVQVLDKGKKVAQFTLAPSNKGAKTVKIKKLKKGKHRLQVVYMGTAQAFGSKSKKIVLYVVK
ncbi:exported hypothetical protein [metagenome]|uniref:Fibronectin type-III domain-containing protein n=1 Tax=metagenome TaxID=256318 RepID=A0A2P2CDS8_9ZZZZ